MDQNLRSLITLSVCSWDTASLEIGCHATALTEARAHAGAAIIQTCQRIEAVGLEPCRRGCPGTREGEAAFRYLVRLAAGLESIVLGESEIVGQVRDAARTATPELGALLGRSIAVARAFRREHAFRADSGHLYDLAVSAAGQSPERVIVVGSGPTARCLVRRVRSGRVRSVVVASRGRPQWISDLGVPWLTLDELDRAKPANMAIVCLGGDAPELAAAMLPASLVVDVSTPRRTAGEVVTLRHLRDHAFAREAEYRERLLAQLDAQSDRAITDWSLDGTSPVGRLRKSAELVRREEVGRIARRHPDIDADTLEAITRRLLNRLLHAPSMRMRQLGPDDASLVADLFEHEPGRTRRWPE